MTKHRWLAWLLILCMVLSCVPAGLAEGGSSSDLLDRISTILNKTKPTATPAPTEAPATEPPAGDTPETPQTESAKGLPVFTLQPSDVNAKANAMVILEGAADGAVSYYWEYSEDVGKTWKKATKAFQGASTKRLFFFATAKMHGWMFRLAAVNKAGTAYSNPVMLTIGSAPAPVKPTQAPKPTAPAPTAPAPTAPAPTAPAPTVPSYDPSDPFAIIPEETTEEPSEYDPKGTPPSITSDPVDVVAADGDSVTMSISATGTISKYQWEYSWDGNELWTPLYNSAFWVGNRTDTMTFTMAPRYNNMWVRCAVTGNGSTVYSEGALIKLGTPPELLMQPSDAYTNKDLFTYFQVKAKDPADVTYQWQMRTSPTGTPTDLTDSGNWEWVTTDRIRVRGSVPFDGYQFRCAVTNGFGTTYSDWATLHIVEAQTPVITKDVGDADPVLLTVKDGDTVTLSLDAINATKYQWEYSKDNGSTWSNLTNGSFWVGNKTDTLEFEAAYSHDGMWFRCAVSNDVPVTVYSYEVHLTVLQLPIITKQPADVSTTSGATATFSITSPNATSYQWQCSKDGGVTWTNLTNGAFWIGNKTNTMHFLTTNYYDGFLFRCVAINEAGKTESDYAILTLSKTPTIKTQPQDQYVAPDAIATFKVVAAGDGPFTYQWQYAPVGTTDFKNVPTSLAGWNTDTLSVPATDPWPEYEYRCIVKKGSVSVTSVSARLYLMTKPVIITDPSDVTVAVDQKATFSISAKYATSYQWEYSTDNKNWAPLGDPSFWVGNHASTLSFKAKQEYDRYYFRCVVTNAYGTAASKSARLYIAGKPVVISGPVTRIVPVGATVYMEVNATGVESYTWQYHNGVKWVSLNNTAIWDGVYTDRLSFVAEKYMDGYRFRCMLKNSSGTVYSPVATLTVNPVLPPQPDGVNIIAAAASSLTVTWTKVTADELNGYKIYYNTVNNPATATLDKVVDPTVKTHTIIGLNPMTTYYVWVTAYNNAGESELNNNNMAIGYTQFADTDLIPPEPPTLVKAKVLSDTKIRVSWNPSPSAGVMGYMIYYATQSLTSNAKLHGVAGPNDTFYDLGGLTPGTTYYIWVAAYNEGGMSLLNNSVRVVAKTTGTSPIPIVPIIPYDLPERPVDVSAKRISDTESEVSWKRSPTTDVTAYKVYYSTIKDPATAKLFATCIPSTRKITVDKLNANFGYHFWVVAVNYDGESEMDEYCHAFADVLDPPETLVPPMQPLNVGAVAAGANKVTLYWDPSPSMPVDGYTIYYSTSSTFSTAKVYTSTGSDSTHVTVMGLKRLTRYYFWVVAYNDAGECTVSTSIRATAITLPY